MTDNSDTPKFLSRQEAAAVLGVDLVTVDRLISTGALARYRIRGRYVRVKASQVRDLAGLPADWLRRC